jgi:16S rRNA (cytidine1402-2'-O)-methyltransferase
LILAATPIGNLEDAPPRLARVLAEADVVACEDTRRTRKLLNHLGVSARELIVYNEATERRVARTLLERIERGGSVVLVSDAGTPGLSDPGYRLVRACAERNLPVSIVPGPNAAVSALAISGLPPGRFVFEGFLPRKPGERRRRIAELAAEERTLVLYESPHRAAATLADLAEVLGGRRAVVVRELTKLHEEVRRATLPELAAWAGSGAPRGELVIVVEGAVGTNRAEPTTAELARRARALMDEGVERRAALREVARQAGVPRRKVFDALLDGAGPERDGRGS